MVTGSVAAMLYGEPRLTHDVDGTSIWIAPPEYVILRELQYFQEGGAPKHLSDIAAMLLQSGDLIDLGAVDQRANEMGLSEAWSRARQAAS